MNDADKIAALTAALKHAGDILTMLADYDSHEMDTARLIAAREGRRVAEKLAELKINF